MTMHPQFTTNDISKAYAVAFRMVGHEEDARDIVQDALLKATASYSRFEGRASLSTWLYKITANTAKMFIRSRKQKSGLASPELVTDIDRLCYASVDTHSRCEARDLIAKIKKKVKPQEWAALYSRSEGLSEKEISSNLGLSESAVKSAVHRARKTARESKF